MKNRRKDKPWKTTKELGEHHIIALIQKNIELMPNMPVPFGDDVSAVEIGNGSLAILKTDMLTNKTDVPKEMSMWQAGRKTIIMNISDFASKGVKPIAIIVSLGLPTTYTSKDIEEIACGLNAGAREYGAYIIGGDIGETSDLIISASLFGTTNKKELMLRSGAKKGDTVAVTGFFGKTGAGLEILLNGLKTTKKGKEKLINSVIMPKARLIEGLTLGASGAVTSSIDSSDGLAWSLYELSKNSHVGFRINNIPIPKEVYEFAESNQLNPLELALYSGEEYELVVTIKTELFEKMVKEIENIGGCLIPIGTVTKDLKIQSDIDGKNRIIEPRGWEHFKS